jgi:hypothetical protein
LLAPEAVRCESVAGIENVAREPPDPLAKLKDLAEPVEVGMTKMLGIERIAVEFWVFFGDPEADVTPDSTIVPTTKTITIAMPAIYPTLNFFRTRTVLRVI